MNTQHHKKRAMVGIVFIPFFILISFCGFRFIKSHQSNSVTTSETSIPEIVSTDSASGISTPITQNSQVISNLLPAKIYIDVPFASQAPLFVWDSLHEDACEEASLLMLKHFINKTQIISPQSFEDEILGVIYFEQQNGYGSSITLAQLNQIAKTKWFCSRRNE